METRERSHDSFDARGQTDPQSAQVPRTEQGKSIDCRAVDAVTDKPVADAVVKIVVRQLRDETGQPSYRELATHTTRTDAKGQFTVVVPQEHLTDSDPQREVDLFVTASHPRYVDSFGFGNPREIAREGITDSSADFRLMKLQPAREIHGRVVDPEGRPLSDTPIYKHYKDQQTRDADNPITTDREGSFRTKVVAGAVLTLEVRTEKGARNYQAVPVDRGDLGVLRIADGVRVTGRVVDSQGRPVQGISLTAPLESKADGQPNFLYRTNSQGRFTTDKLLPGKYLLTVDNIYDPDHVGFPIAEAPGVYVPLPLEVGTQPVADVTIAPVEDVRCVVTLKTTRPLPVADEKQNDPNSCKETSKLFSEAFLHVPFFPSAAAIKAFLGPVPRRVSSIPSAATRNPRRSPGRSRVPGTLAPCAWRKD